MNSLSHKLWRRAALLWVLTALMLAACTSSSGRVEIRNNAGQPIDTLTVDVAGSTLTFEDIPPGGEAVQRFPVEGDSSFSVRGTLSDGTEISGEFGYVTTGAGVWNHGLFTVQPSGLVDFVQGD